MGSPMLITLEAGSWLETLLSAVLRARSARWAALPARPDQASGWVGIGSTGGANGSGSGAETYPRLPKNYATASMATKEMVFMNCPRT